MFLGVIAIVGCGNPAQYVHNPHALEMVVKIDDKEFFIQPDEQIDVELGLGTHTITTHVNNELILDTTVTFDNGFVSKGGILNISGQSMFLFSEFYGTEMSQTFNNSSDDNINMVFVDSTLIIGDVIEYDTKTILLPKNWDLDLFEPFKDEIEVYNYSTGKTIKKIFTEKDLIAYWNKTYANELDGIFDGYEESDLDELESLLEE